MVKKRAARSTYYVDPAIIAKNAKSDEQLTFALTLNNLLFEKNINQDDMAAAIDIQMSSLSKYRRAETEPKLTTLVKMAEYLHVDCHYLMTGIKADQKTLSDELGLSSNSINSLQNLAQARNGKYVPEYIKEEVRGRYKELIVEEKENITYYTECLEHAEVNFDEDDGVWAGKKYDTIESYKDAINEDLELFKLGVSATEDSEIPMYEYFEHASNAIDGINLLLSQPKPEVLFNLIAAYSFSHQKESDFNSYSRNICLWKKNSSSSISRELDFFSVSLNVLLSEIQKELISIRDNTTKKYELRLE